MEKYYAIKPGFKQGGKGEGVGHYKRKDFFKTCYTALLVQKLGGGKNCQNSSPVIFKAPQQKKGQSAIKLEWMGKALIARPLRKYFLFCFEVFLTYS